MDENESILEHIKKLRNANDNYFDTDIITYINVAFARLNQLGVGPKTTFAIHDATTTWKSFSGDDTALLPMVQAYVDLTVKLMFDPPTTAVLMNEITKQIDKYEWLLNVAVDPSNK